MQNYIDDTLRLLRDANNTYFSPTDINAWINRARRRRDRDTGINRTLVTFPLVVGQTTYSMLTVNANAFDVVGIVLIYSNIRVDLENPSYRDLAATYLSVVSYNDVPRAFAKYGPSNIVIGPPPNQAYSTEWDMLQTGPDLVNTTDVDSIPAPWTEPVPFAAAHYAKLELGEQDDAKRFEDMYLAQTIEIMSSTRGMQVPDPYFATGRRYGNSR